MRRIGYFPLGLAGFGLGRCTTFGPGDPGITLTGRSRTVFGNANSFTPLRDAQEKRRPAWARWPRSLLLLALGDALSTDAARARAHSDVPSELDPAQVTDGRPGCVGNNNPAGTAFATLGCLRGCEDGRAGI
jgi:hypothetical protein